MPEANPVDDVPTPQKPRASWYAPGLSDGIGDRLLMFDNSDRPSLELLRFRQDFASVPAFEQALRDRVRRLGQFTHPAFARVRSVQRLEPDNDLALVSNSTPGKRLSEILPQVRGAAFAAAVIKQLGPALAELQQHEPGMAHGLLNPDRIVVSPDGQLTIVEHVVGPAIDALDLRGSQLAAAGITLPPSEDGRIQRLDPGGDWYQLAVIAVSVLLGRPLAAHELPELPALLDSLESTAGDDEAMPPAMRQWLDRALRLAGPRIESGEQGQAALRTLLRHQLPEATVAPDLVTPPALISTRSEPKPRPAPATRPAPAAAPRIAERPRAPEPRAPELRPVEPRVNRPAASVAPATSTPVVEVIPAPAAAPAAPPGTLFGRDVNTSAAPERPAVSRPRTVERAATADGPRRNRSTTVLVAALGLIAAVEAGVIVGLARAVWFAAPPPVIAAADPAGGAVTVDSRDNADAPLGVAVDPALRWVRVVAPARGGSRRSAAIEIASPIDLTVFEGARQIGTVPGPAFELTPGVHELTLVNRGLGYSEKQRLDVQAGQAVSIHVAPQHGWLTIDAAPWADVAVDGESVGRTPLATVPAGPGEHEITFRNPAAGTDRQRVVVKSDAITRVTGNLRR